MVEKAEVKKEEQGEDKTFQMLEAVLARTMPASAVDAYEAILKDHESNLVDHDDKVAVLDISTPMVPEIDGIPGWYRVVRDDESNGKMFTKQGLRIYDRYRVVVNYIPDSRRVYQFAIVDKKEWDDHVKNTRTGSEMMSGMQELSGLMLRSGGS